LSASEPNTADLYPLAEKAPERVRSRSGKALTELSLDAIVEGGLGIEDLRIAPEGLTAQAEVARAAGRPTLARNLERAAELVAVPEELLMRVYELLRPGRAKSRDELLAAAAILRADYGAERNARLIEEAAEMYERRGLFRKRY
jgi:propanediol dehydratase small subunit